MDKYEYNLKLEEIDKLVDQGDYEEAANLADTIDWKRVRNIRTLCLISEIYEASGRLEDSKNLLVRAYKRSPVGKTILYRLVEVTTALQQYDEALEYYSEYVQVAPHDSNRYILKYLIYRGRGSAVEELITILEEYLGQEYTERWAYELAKLYQQAGQMQNCYAACDDLVLWFHSGKYVRKALELKQRYTSLTPRQQQLYEECLQEEAEQQEEPSETEDTVIHSVPEADGEVIAETIIAQTEREIAGEVTARKAEMEREAAHMAKRQEEAVEGKETSQDKRIAGAGQGVPQDTRVAGAGQGVPQNTRVAGAGQGVPQDTRVAKADQGVSQDTRVAKAGQGVSQDTRVAKAGQGVSQDTRAAGVNQGAVQSVPDYNEKDLRLEFAKSMQEVISGVVRRNLENEEDIPASVDTRIHKVDRVEIPEVQEPTAGKLSIDDILLSMGEKGKRIAAEAMRAEAEAKQRADEAAAGEKVQAGAVKYAGTLNQSGASENEKTVNEIETPHERKDAESGKSVSAAETSGEPNTGGADKPVSEIGASGAANAAGSGKLMSKAEVSGAQNTDGETETVSGRPMKTATEVVTEGLTDLQREALQYTSHPERLLRNRNALPTYMEEKKTVPGEDFGATRRISTKEELAEAARREILAGKTIRIPTEEIDRARRAEQTISEKVQPESEIQTEVPEQKELSTPEAEPVTKKRTGLFGRKKTQKTENSRTAQSKEKRRPMGGYAEDETAGAYANGEAAKQYAEGKMAGAYADGETVERYAEDEMAGAYADGETVERYTEDEMAGAYADGETTELYAEGRTAGAYPNGEADDSVSEDLSSNEMMEGVPEGDETTQDLQEEYLDDESYDEPSEEEYLHLPDHLRNLFSGFTEIEGLEDQIANAIIQAEAKGEDRTSRTGNILIFGAHGSGKTTLAMNIAKAVAQDKGNQVMKMAKIYAADLNRKDIAATIARIAGGTLIIEEAGDLEPNTVEQLTTAMEFRTDGLIVILEDEQQYIHDLLMKHPRFTMKFTAQIYIPVYTPEELAMFGQIYANAQDYVISEEALGTLYDQISATAASGKATAISDVIESVNRAIQSSNKLMRKLSMGKKRYDENDYIILFPKDFR